MFRALTTLPAALAAASAAPLSLVRGLAQQTGEPQGGSGWIMGIAITLGLSAVAVLLYVVTKREP